MSLATVQPRFPQSQSRIWKTLVEEALPNATDPWPDWIEQFDAWRNEIQRLRKFEADVFFQQPRSPATVRLHRGFLCHLISEGERLALLLLEDGSARFVEDGEIRKQLSFLDEFNVELRSTLETWHSLEERAVVENPLTNGFTAAG